jgi:hypothetical protein
VGAGLVAQACANTMIRLLSRAEPDFQFLVDFVFVFFSFELVKEWAGLVFSFRP